MSKKSCFVVNTLHGVVLPGDTKSSVRVMISFYKKEKGPSTAETICLDFPTVDEATAYFEKIIEQIKDLRSC